MDSCTAQGVAYRSGRCHAEQVKKTPDLDGTASAWTRLQYQRAQSRGRRLVARWRQARLRFVPRAAEVPHPGMPHRLPSASTAG